MLRFLNPFSSRQITALAAIALTIALSLAVPARPIAAQTALTLDAPITDTLTNAPLDYAFQGVSGQVISISVQAVDDTLDPTVTLLDSTGRVLLTNDDYAYPASRDALLEAITLPRIDTYTVRVAGYGASGGAFTLTVRSGYAALSSSDDFASAVGWEADASAGVRVEGRELLVSFDGQGFSTAFSTTAPAVSEYYARVRVTELEAAAPNWIAGIAARYGPNTRYALLVRADGTYRFIRRSGDDETVLRDWSTHPAIVAGQTAFTLGLLARNHGFHLFYNDSPLITIAADDVTGTAQIGVAAGIGGALPAEAAVRFDDLVVTAPLYVDGAPVLPEQFLVGDAQSMALALVRRHIVSAAGQMALTVPEASVQYARSGVNRLMLGGGTTYGSFALGAAVELQQGTTGLSGCGLVFRSLSDDDYALAFFDADGGYGLSLQQNGLFEPGLFGQADDAPTTRHLLVIADNTTLSVFVDGRSIGSLTAPAAVGEVGLAVVNYDSVDTTCTARNLWVWRWEG